MTENYAAITNVIRGYVKNCLSSLDAAGLTIVGSIHDFKT